MAPRVRAAASACLVASGLLISGVGGAMALADSGQGHGQGNSEDRKDSDDHSADGSVGDIVRQALGLADGNSEKVFNPWQRPDTRLGNGRADSESPKRKPPTDPKETPEKPPEESEEPCPTSGSTTPTKPPGEPPPFPEAGGGGGGGAVVPLPRYKPPQVPDMQLPAELQPSPPGVPGVPPVLDAGAAAIAAPPAIGPVVPIAVPVIVAPPLGLGVGGGGAAGAAAGPPPAAPRGLPAQPPAGRNAPPAQAGSKAAAPNASYRIGYTEYLRTAGLPQVAALAVPGLVGILVLTGAGGLVGYRQAKAGHAVHVGGSARFMR